MGSKFRRGWSHDKNDTLMAMVLTLFILNQTEFSMSGCIIKKGSKENLGRLFNNPQMHEIGI